MTEPPKEMWMAPQCERCTSQPYDISAVSPIAWSMNCEACGAAPIRYVLAKEGE